jgi:HPt (histidine-containing phosphotransfer) domain-containing protein
MTAISEDSIEKIKVYLKEEFELDDDDISEMLEAFVINMEQMVNNASEKLASSSLYEVGRIGHSIKGAAANLSANNISELGKQLQTEAEAGNQVECQNIITELSDTINNLKMSRENA